MKADNFKILFIESPYSYGGDNIVVGRYYPLGIGYLAAYVRQHGYPVKIFQPKNTKNFDSELISLLKSYNPDLVGISAMTPTYPKAIDLCNLVKKFTDARTVLGGHHVSAVREEVFKDSVEVDYLIIGEGEITFHELIKKISDDGDLKDVRGLIWKDSNGDIVRNSPGELIKDIDLLPFPARDPVDLSQYGVHSYINFGKKAASLISSRGCPYRCSYCSSFLTMGRQFRFRTAQNVLSEIEELIEKYNVDHLVFEDDVLTLKRDRTIKICEGILKLKKPVSWYCLSRVDTIDLELATLMKESGCRMINFGIESGSPEILRTIHKKISLERAEEAIGICNKVGLRTQGTFIVGFPFDTCKTMQMTLDVAKRISPTIAIFFPLTPYPGTEIYDKYFLPELKPKDVNDWKQFIVTSVSNGIKINKQFSPSYIRKISAQWTWKYYLRVSQIFRLVKTIKSWNEIKYIFRSGVMLGIRMMKSVFLR